MKIIKKSGKIEEFSLNKLRHSLSRSGITEKQLEEIVQAVKSQMHDGIKTRQIYRMAGKLLKKIAASHAARYNLRTAIQQLGPAGFFFEKFIALLYRHEGYESKTNLVLQGRCVSHEIDLVMKKDNLVTMIECKFHAGSEAVSDVKVPMYILSRFNDLKDDIHLLFDQMETIRKCKIATNNRFTTEAQRFAVCSGLELLSWDYPQGDSLKSKIDNGNLYPVTCLTTLSMVEKEKLLIVGVILASQLMEAPDTLLQVGISEGRISKIISEAAGLCKILTT